MTNLITKAKDFYTGHKKLVVVLGILFLILLVVGVFYIKLINEEEEIM